MFLIAALFPALTLSASFCIREKHVAPEKPRRPQQSRLSHVKAKAIVVCRYVAQGFILRAMVFIFLVTISPGADTALFYFYTNGLNFGPKTLANMSLVQSLANIVGVLFYNRCLSKVGFRRVIFWTTLGSAVTMALRLLFVLDLEHAWLRSPAFIYVLAFLFSFVGELHLMPVMVMACRLCPKTYEASVYEFIMAIVNLGYLVSY